MTQRLNHVIAITKSTKSEVNKDLSALYKLIQKKDVFAGLTRTWSPADDEGPVYQDESKKVIHRVPDVIASARSAWARVMDVEATRDFANMSATADVVVDGVILIQGAPVTFLLALEKQLKDMASFVENLPELDPSGSWSWDSGSMLFKGEPRETYKTRKTTDPVVVTEATEKHPAQWTNVTKDIREGTWTTTALSGATTTSRKKLLRERVQALRDAVHVARESANMSPAPPKDVSLGILDYIFPSD
jgi:hypothetical protein